MIYPRTQRDTRDDLQEILHDISFGIGARWHTLSADVASDLMDHCEGSRGLKDMCIAWANEFDTMWSSLPQSKREDYMVDVDRFTEEKFAALVAEVRLDG